MMLDCEEAVSPGVKIMIDEGQFGTTLSFGNDHARYPFSARGPAFMSGHGLVFLSTTDHPVPFFAQRTPVTWLGERALGEISVENLDDVAQYAPGFGQSSDSISLHFVDDAIARERSGDLRGSLGLIYQRVDEMMRFGMIDLLEEELASIRAESVGSDVLLGLLTATLPVKSQLPSRRALFKATKRLLKSRGHYEPGILDGLR